MISGDIKNNDELERSKISITAFLRLMYCPELTPNMEKSDLTKVHDFLTECMNGNNRYEYFERWKQSQDNTVTQKITLRELQRLTKPIGCSVTLQNCIKRSLGIKTKIHPDDIE